MKKNKNTFINEDLSLLLKKLNTSEISSILTRLEVKHKPDSLRDCIYTLCNEGKDLTKTTVDDILNTKNQDNTPRFSSDASRRVMKSTFLQNTIFTEEPPHFFTDKFLLDFQAAVLNKIKEKKDQEKRIKEYAESLTAKIEKSNTDSDLLCESVRNILAEPEIKEKITHRINDYIITNQGLCEIVLDFTEDIELKNFAVAEALLECPDATICVFEDALAEIGAKVIAKRTKIKNNKIIRVPEVQELRLIPRFINLPQHSETTIKNLNSNMLHTLVKIKGVVTKLTKIQHKVTNAKFICNRCGNEIWIEQPAARRTLTPPAVCNSCDRREFRFIPDESEMADVQFLQIRDAFETMNEQGEPESIDGWLMNDLVNTVYPGNNVFINGIPRLIKRGKGNEAVYDRFLEINSVELLDDNGAVELTDTDIEEIEALKKEGNLLEKEVNSIAPNIYGNKKLKELGVLYLCGGSGNKRDASGNEIREEIHLLVIGDPGVTKTLTAEEIAKRSPSVIYIDAKNTSGAGLTATADRDPFYNAWVLKAGAIVKSRRTIIDEFDKFDDKELHELNTPMQSQRLIVCKAGITANYKIKTGILALANPKGERFDLSKEIHKQISCPRTTLSRFDLIVPMFKVQNVEERKAIRDHMMTPWTNDSAREQEGIIPPELFKKIIIYAQKINPGLSKGAIQIIKKYTDHLLENEGADAVSFMERQIHPIIRLTTARARAQLKDMADEDDAKAVIRIYDYFLKKLATDTQGRIDYSKIFGDSRDTREKFETIRGVVKEISDASDTKTAPVDEVEKRVDVPVEEFDQLINEMKSKGEIWEAKPGMLKLREY
ncbi:hypothetical protein BEH94_09195 [Candidatus Altiarchaeales archaeon WOR_SM1_SCG]|nr:hypothetical protein BEH94_09195 [Candidatus Altiarchaeales archaeon WOR_SM1_SCG]